MWRGQPNQRIEFLFPWFLLFIYDFLFTIIFLPVLWSYFLFLHKNSGFILFHFDLYCVHLKSFEYCIQHPNALQWHQRPSYTNLLLFWFVFLLLAFIQRYKFLWFSFNCFFSDRCYSIVYPAPNFRTLLYRYIWMLHARIVFFCFATKNQTWKEQKTREFISIFYDVHLPFVCVSKEAHEFYESNMGTWIVDGLLNFCLTVQMTCCDASVSRVQQ